MVANKFRLNWVKFAVLVGVFFIAALLALAFVNSTVMADDICEPVNGHLSEEIQIDDCPEGFLCTTGRYNGGIQGTYSFKLNLAEDIEESNTPGVVHFSATSTIETKEGITLYLSEAGSIDLLRPPGNLADLQTILPADNEGTYGQIFLYGHFDGMTGTSDYRGTICTPPED